MTNEQIIKKAIEKAVKNGFNFSSIDERIEKNDFEVVNIFDIKVYNMYVSIHEIIFSHDFAKAFFGVGKNEKLGCKRVCYSPWKGNLQTMVILEDKIKYLEQFLKK